MQYDTKDKIKAKLKENKTRVKNQSSPQLKRETNTKLSSQASKLGLVKGFGKDVCKLILGINMV